MPDNKLILKIADISIPVATSEDEAYTRSLAEDIDADMREILDSNQNASVTSAALLCAIDYLDSFRKANRSTNNLRNQIKEYLADAANAKLQFDEECKKTSELTVELNAMRTHLTRIASEGDASGAVEQLKAQLSKATNEINRGKKQVGDLMLQINAMAEKSNAMSEYISGQDKEIARLNSVISIHLETIASLQEKLRVREAQLENRDVPAPPRAALAGSETQIIEQAQEEIQSVLASIQTRREDVPAPASAPQPERAPFAPVQAPTPEPVPGPAPEMSAPPAPAPVQTSAPAVEQTTLETPADDLFFNPAPGAEETPQPMAEAAEPDIVEELDAPDGDPIKKLEDEISSFPFDIDIEDKPEEFFRGEYAIKDKQREAERAAQEEKERAPKQPARDDDMPDLDWTRDL